jgi:hypothetical protein
MAQTDNPRMKITIRFKGKQVFHSDDLVLDACMREIEKWRDEAIPMRGKLDIYLSEIEV